MTQKTRTLCTYWSPLHPGKSVLKSKGGSIWISNIWKYFTWLKLQECKQISWFWNTQKICMPNSSVFQKLLLEKDMISFQIKARHLHIGSEWLCQPEIGYTTLYFFSNQHTHYHIDFALFINNGGRTWKTNWFQHNIYIFISISISGVCRLGHCTSFAKCQGWYKICWDNWGTKTTIKELQEELAEFNRVRYRTLPGNASRGKNVLRT